MSEDIYRYQEIDYTKKPNDGCLSAIFWIIITIIGFYLFVKIISNLLGIGNVNM